MNVTSNSTHWGWNLLTLPVSTYVTEGLTGLSGFEVLRHGPSFFGYINILRNGGDPQFGGKTTEEVASDDVGKEEAAACKGYFYVFKDSEACLDDTHVVVDSNGKPLKDAQGELVTKRCYSPTAGLVIKRTFPRFHAALAGAYYAKNIKNRVARYALKFFYGVIHFLFCPTIRFVYRKEEIRAEYDKYKFALYEADLFHDDPNYGGTAYRTKQLLPNDRIGLIGLCKQITWNDVKRTFTKTPGKAVLGTVQLIVGIALTCLGVGLFL